MNRFVVWHLNWRRAFQIAVAAAILLGAQLAFAQNEGSGAPNPANRFTSPIQTGHQAGHAVRFVRPQTAQAAPRHMQRQTQRLPQRLRMSRADVARSGTGKEKPPVEASVPVAAPEIPAEPAWPNAQDNVGIAGIVPVVIRTVREMAEPEPETPAVLASELSDIDLFAKPMAIRDDIPVAGTDGRGNVEDELRGNRFAAFAENAKSIGSAAWLEPIALVLAGAFAAMAAMRLFAA